MGNPYGKMHNTIVILLFNFFLFKMLYIRIVYLDLLQKYTTQKYCYPIASKFNYFKFKASNSFIAFVSLSVILYAFI